MSSTTNFFVDPTQFPVRFVQRIPKPIFSFGESSFPVSFSFDASPRTAYFAGASVKQLDVFLTDKNVYSDPVVQSAYGQSQSFVLSATGNDVRTASFFLSTTKTDETPVIASAYGLLEVRQPTFSSGIPHLFSTHINAISFDSVVESGDYYWPVAVMRVVVHRMLSSGDETLTTVVTSKDDSTPIVLAPADSWGIVDVEIAVAIQWYEEEARETLSSSPPQVDAPSFGLRVYVSKPDSLSQKISIVDRTCVAESLYPSTILNSLGGGSSISLAYWGVGDDSVGLFWGLEAGIEISSNGLPIQSGDETASYIIANQLDDYDTSSSSSSSISSINSSSSSSSPLKSSLSSQSSLSSLSTISSVSSSSVSTMSSVSSSSSSLSSLSSLSEVSSSSSSILLSLSSSSSVEAIAIMSSTSSIDASIIATYTFSAAPDVMGVVEDTSGNDHDIKIGDVSGGMGPPQWISDGGMSGGGMSFFADSLNADYMFADDISWIINAKSIAMWLRGGSSGNRISVPFCVSNWIEDEAFIPMSSKSETAIQMDQTTGCISAWTIVDGTTKWKASTAAASVGPGVWVHVVVAHDGYEPKVYINGVSSALTYSIDVDRTAWVDSAMAATHPASRMMIGGAPRPYSPYISLGFSGIMDEIILWDAPLSEYAATAEFEKAEYYSSASSSSSMSFSSATS